MNHDEEVESTETEPLNKNFKKGAIIEDDKSKKKKQNESIPYYKLYRYATPLDKLFIFLGSVSIIITGLAHPYMMVLFSQITGDIVAYAAHFYTNETITPTQKEHYDNILYDQVYFFGVTTAILGVVSIVFTYLSGLMFNWSCLRQIYKIRQRFLEKTLAQDVEWYDVNKTGDFATSFTDNLDKIEDGIGDKISLFLFYQTVCVVSVIWALILGWKLALVCLVSFPISTATMAFVTWLSTKFSRQEMESYSKAGAIAEEVLTSIRTVVAFEGQDKEVVRYNEHLTDARDNNVRRNLFNGINNGLLWFFVYTSYALSFWYGVGLILEEKYIEDAVYTPGNMIAVFFNTLMASWNFGLGAPFLQTFGTACGAAHKIFSVLDSEPKIQDKDNSGVKKSKIQGNIVFEDVFFNYPSRSDVKVLNKLSLKVEAGQTVALVGESGCGKSTCIQLLQRFYDPDSGNIFIDDTNIKDYNLGWLRNQVGVVGQEPALFATTIAENIRYGKLTATQDEIEKAAKKANAHQFIKSLPQGYDTIIGERGAQLSGGQKQRVAIARALIREPSVLLLDEATSALDTASEAEVQAALDKISHFCTTIVVAHRLSTVRNANKIVVLEKGQMVEEGTHSELIEKKGAYFNLVKHHTSEDVKKETIIESQPIVNGHDYERKESIFDIQRFEHRKSDAHIKEDKNILFRVLKLNSPEWFYIVLGCLSSIVTGAGLPIYSVVFGDIIGVLASNDDEFVRTESNKFCLYFLILGIVTGIVWFTQIYFFGLAGEQLTLRVRHRMFSTILNQEIGWYDKKENGVGALCAKLSGDAANIQGASGMPIGTALNSIATLILANAFGLFFNWKLALVLMTFSPLTFVSIYFEQKILQGDSTSRQRILEDSAKIAVEAVGNVRTIKSLGCEEKFVENFLEALHPYQKMAKKKAHFRSLALGFAKSLFFWAYTVAMTYGVKLIITEGVDYANVFKVAECVILGAWSIGNTFAFSPNFQKGLTAARRMFELFDRVPKIRNIAYPSTKPWEEGNIEYSRVYFSYPTRPTIPVIKGLDLSILKNKTVALVGSSGSGKSTVIQLLERFYSPTSGEVSIDDTNINVMDMKVLRSQLGIVSQEPNLFDRTIAENIAYGANDRNVPQDEIIEAAKKANIHNFICSLPLGYETNLGSKGTQLSGGQKQRVAIARALVRNPKVLLLDEATSALDNESEKIVQEALDKAREGRTCITIAHRLTTIQDADVICVLNKGKIVEMGTHNDLLQKRGFYYDFYKLQTAG